MTDITGWRNRLFEAIGQAGLLRQSRQIELDNGRIALSGRLVVEGHAIEVAVCVDPLLENRLPQFFLRPLNALGFIPHIDPDGLICFLEYEGMVFDRNRQVEVVFECFGQVLRTLSKGVTGVNWQDFIDEFEIYWARLNNLQMALANLDLLDFERVAEITVGVSPHAMPGLRITHQAEQLIHIPAAQANQGPWTTHYALYLPLEAGTRLLPPQSEPPFWGIDGIGRLLHHCTAANRERLEALLQQRAHTHEYLIARLPRPAGDAVFFGVRFEELGEQHPLINADKASATTPIYIHRRDKRYLVQRGGGQVDLAEKRVLLIGCGAVGGQIAFELSRAGIERLHLVDPDVLTPENTYRHVLGKRHWGVEKAVALRQALRSQLPFSKAESFVGTIEQLASSNTIDTFSYDLIISAIGSPTSELALNEYVRRSASGPPIIFTWVDPYGIGGHAVLTGLIGSIGCFECLYVQANAAEHLHNRASFAAPGQVFRQSRAGCHNLYTPYGSLDAAQTGQLAIRLAVDALAGRTRENCVRSWKGDAAEFLAEGFTLSTRYHLSLDALKQLETCFASNECSVCRATGDGAQV
jgi:molybdopterin-synthase adenylyltransferase